MSGEENVSLKNNLVNYLSDFSGKVPPIKFRNVLAIPRNLYHNSFMRQEHLCVYVSRRGMQASLLWKMTASKIP
jgi:hypothetical protein